MHGAPPTCGAIFDAARPADELARIEERVADPDFWKDQAGAQKLLQRRRRLEEDVDLSQSLKRGLDDIAVLVEWAERVPELAGRATAVVHLDIPKGGNGRSALVTFVDGRLP